jgi:hypothetical protein
MSAWWRADARVWRDRVLIGGAFTYSVGWGAGCLLVLLALFFWERRQGEPGWQPTALDRAAVVFFIVLVISSVWSEWRWRALTGTVELALAAFIAVRAVILSYVHDRTFAERFAGAWTAGGAVVGVIGLIITLLRIGMPDGRLQLTIGSNSLGSIFAMAAMLLLVAFVKESGPRRWFACAGVSAVIVALALSQSRGGWLGAAIGVVTLSVLVPPRRFLLCLCVAAVALVAAAPLITAGIAAQTARLSETLNTEEIRSRPAIWRTIPRMLTGHLLLGIGLTTFPLAYRRVVPEAVALDLSPHAHNVFLSFLAETGVAGLLAFIGVIAAIIAAMWRWHTAGPPPPPDRLISAGVLSAFAALLGHHLVDMTLFGVHIATGFFFLAGLGAAGDLLRRPGVVN